MSSFDVDKLPDEARAKLREFTASLTQEQQDLFASQISTSRRENSSSQTGGSSSGGATPTTETALVGATAALQAAATQMALANKASLDKEVKRIVPSVRPDATKGILAVLSSQGRGLHESTILRWAIPQVVPLARLTKKFLADPTLTETAAQIKVPLPLEMDLKLTGVEFHQATELAIKLWKDDTASPFDAGKPDHERWWYQFEKHWENIKDRTPDFDDPYDLRLALEYDVAVRNRLRHATYGYTVGDFKFELWTDLRSKIMAEKAWAQAAAPYNGRTYRSVEVSPHR
jgi:hypothetical protein